MMSPTLNVVLLIVAVQNTYKGVISDVVGLLPDRVDTCISVCPWTLSRMCPLKELAPESGHS